MDKEIYAINIEDKGSILCQGFVIYTKELPEYIQLCFFESEKAIQQYMYSNGMISKNRYKFNLFARYIVQRLMPPAIRKRFYNIFLRKR